MTEKRVAPTATPPLTAPHRIALVTSSFAPHFGGVEEHVAQVARQLHARGDLVEVWTVDRGRAAERPFTGHDGTTIPVRYLPTPLPARSVTALLKFALRAPKAWFAWRRAHRRLRPDVLHVHCFGPNGVYANALRRRFGTPLIVTSHGETRGDDTSIFARSALLRRGLRDALARAAVTTAPTEFVLEDLRNRFGLHGGEVVPNGVRLDLPSRGEAPSGRFLVAVGRLGRMKGFDLLIDAFAAARTPGHLDPAVRLLIAGDGPERERLETQVRRLALEGSVELLGWRSPDQVATLLEAAEAVVVPSRSEAFGIIALEAWRAGTALIMTSRGGASEFMTHGVDALLVDPEDRTALADALERLATDSGLRAILGAAGATRVVEFTWERVADAYQALYNEAAPRANSV